MAKSGDRQKINPIWVVGQTQPRHQRGPWYVQSTTDHPAKMWPVVAAHAIGLFSKPGDWVFDPMCGIGTTVVEALLLGRNSFGIELEKKWWAIAKQNLSRAEKIAPQVSGNIHRGDATAVDYRACGPVSQVDLVVTSPPYGALAHGRPIVPGHGNGQISTTRYRYSESKQTGKNQLATSSRARLHSGLENVFARCFDVLRPGGYLVVMVRPYAHSGVLVDFPSVVASVALDVGFTFQHRIAAILGRWDGTTLVPHSTFFHLMGTRKKIANGERAFLRVHEDILVFERPSIEQGRLLWPDIVSAVVVAANPIALNCVGMLALARGRIHARVVTGLPLPSAITQGLFWPAAEKFMADDRKISVSSDLRTPINSALLVEILAELFGTFPLTSNNVDGSHQERDEHNVTIQESTAGGSLSSSL